MTILLVVAYIIGWVWAIKTGTVMLLVLWSLPLAGFIVWLAIMAIEYQIWLYFFKKGLNMNSKYYNDVPETRGTARNKGTYIEPTARDLEDALRLAAFQKAEVEAKEEADNAA